MKALKRRQRKNEKRVINFTEKEFEKKLEKSSPKLKEYFYKLTDAKTIKKFKINLMNF